MYLGFLIVTLACLYHGVTAASSVIPGYLDFDNLPDTNFSCKDKVIGGYYADVETGCQMFHVCTIGQKGEVSDIKFLCLNGTVFDQATRVCERVDEVDCSKAEEFFDLNLELYGNNAFSFQNEPEDSNTDLNLDHESQKEQLTSTSTTTTTTTTTTTARPTTTPSTTPLPITTSSLPIIHYQSVTTHRPLYNSQIKNQHDIRQNVLPTQHTVTQRVPNFQTISSTLTYNPYLLKVTTPSPHEHRYPSSPSTGISALLAIRDAYGDNENNDQFDDDLIDYGSGEGFEEEEEEEPIAIHKPISQSNRYPVTAIGQEKIKVENNGDVNANRPINGHSSFTESLAPLNHHVNHGYTINRPQQITSDHHTRYGGGYDSAHENSNIHSQHKLNTDFILNRQLENERHQHHGGYNSNQGHLNQFIYSTTTQNPLFYNQNPTYSSTIQPFLLPNPAQAPQINGRQSLLKRKLQDEILPAAFQANRNPLFTTPSIAIVSQTSSTSFVSSGSKTTIPTVPSNGTILGISSISSVNGFPGTIIHGDPHVHKNHHYQRNPHNLTLELLDFVQKYVETTPPNSYDEYLESDVQKDPFFKDVPRITAKKSHRGLRRKRQVDTQTSRQIREQDESSQELSPGSLEISRSVRRRMRPANMAGEEGDSNIRRNSNQRVSPLVETNTRQSIPLVVTSPKGLLSSSELDTTSTPRKTISRYRQRPLMPTVQTPELTVDVPRGPGGPGISLEAFGPVDRRNRQRISTPRETRPRKVSQFPPREPVAVAKSPKNQSTVSSERSRQFTEMPRKPIENVENIPLVIPTPKSSTTYKRVDESQRRIPDRAEALPRTRLRQRNNPRSSTETTSQTIAGRNSQSRSYRGDSRRTNIPSRGTQYENKGADQIVSSQMTSETLTSPETERPPLPETSFSCADKVPGGYYADLEADCQLFHICSQGRHGRIKDNKFLCGPGTRFNQQSRTCQTRDLVDCQLSASLYHLNNHFNHPSTDEVSVPAVAFEAHRVNREKRATLSGTAIENKNHEGLEYYDDYEEEPILTAATSTTTVPSLRQELTSTSPVKDEEYYDDYQDDSLLSNISVKNVINTSDDHVNIPSIKSIQQPVEELKSTSAPVRDADYYLNNEYVNDNYEPITYNDTDRDINKTGSQEDLTISSKPQSVMVPIANNTEVDYVYYDDYEEVLQDSTVSPIPSTTQRINVDEIYFTTTYEELLERDATSTTEISEVEVTKKDPMMDKLRDAVMTFLKNEANTVEIETELQSEKEIESVSEIVTEPTLEPATEQILETVGEPVTNIYSTTDINTETLATTEFNDVVISTTESISLTEPTSPVTSSKTENRYRRPTLSTTRASGSPHRISTARRTSDVLTRKPKIRTRTEVRATESSVFTTNLVQDQEIITPTENYGKDIKSFDPSLVLHSFSKAHDLVAPPEGRKVEQNESGNQRFNCYGRELYKFYPDAGSSKLFHYCSPGFHTKQKLDLQFICDNNTRFNPTSQKCE